MIRTRPNMIWRGDQLIIARVLAAYDDAPLAQPAPPTFDPRLIAAQLKRERRNAKRAARTHGAVP